jgi:hypothetical protein
MSTEDNRHEGEGDGDPAQGGGPCRDGEKETAAGESVDAVGGEGLGSATDET